MHKALIIVTAIILASCTFVNSPFLAPDYSSVQAQVTDFQEVNDRTFNDLNPLVISGSSQAQALSSPGGILSRILLFAFPIAGLILFIMVIWGGFEIVSGSATKKSIDAGKQRITTALLGFLLLFVSFWIIQLIEVGFGIDIFLGESTRQTGGSGSGVPGGGSDPTRNLQ